MESSVSKDSESQQATQPNTRLYWMLYGLLQIALVAVAFTAGYFFNQWYGGAELSLVHRALQIVTDNAYDPLPQPSALQYGAIRGMLQVMKDPYTSFFEPPQAELQSNQLQGRYGGVGVRMERDSEQFIYLYPLPGSPAAEAGIQEGDRLLAVDKRPIFPETTYDEVQAAIRGPVGERVTLTVGREPNFQPVDFTLKRAEVPLPSVTWNLAAEEPKVGVIQINVIAETTPNEVKNAVLDLQQRGASFLVLDLRNNGGGLVDAGVDTARLFLSTGTIMQQQYRGQDVKTYSVDTPGPFSSIPLVILVNKNTASAAEILAGALQAQKRARLVGVPTFGKDSIQLVFDLNDGSSLHVTAARWWIPNLQPEIKGNGLQPDISAPNDDPEAPLLLAIEALLSR